MEALGHKFEVPEIKPVKFMMNRDAMEEMYKRIWRNSSYTEGFKIKNSELWFSLRDPAPELYRRFLQ
jgi:hypothetical protein